MTGDTSREAGELFEKGNHYSLDNAEVLVYGLNGATTLEIQQVCNEATESYARKILNWPNGQLEKPHIFKVVAQAGQLQNVNDCIEQFVGRLRQLFNSSPPYDLPIYPHAFIIVDMERLQSSKTVTLVVAYKPHGEWKTGHCLVPVQAELGLTVESLRMGDVTEEDILNQFSDSKQ
ncbi:hypothetical protein ACHAP5_006718 [Fusarium lateritium]